MAKTRYIFDHRSEKAVLYQAGKFLFPIGGSKAEHWVDGDYVFSLATQKITHWILGRDLYGHLGNGELTRDPVFYFGE